MAHTHSEAGHGHTHAHEHDCGCGHKHTHTNAHGDDCGCGHDHGKATSRGEVIRLVLAAALFALSFLPLPYGWYAPVMLALAVWPLGIPLVREIWEEWRAHRIGEHTLLLAAVPAAFAIGEYREGALVVLLFALGELIEDVAVNRSNRALSALAKIRPDSAVRVDADGTHHTVPADDIAVGERLLIAPHTRVPVDGEVIAGVSAVDTAALTGESLPQAVTVGDTVLSGSINGEGTLELCATAVAAQSAAARVIALVADATAQKGHSQRFITRFAARYTPAVLVLAILLTAIPTLCGGNLTTWMYRSLVFLVASCPCAMVISVPLSFYAGIGAASKRGVLIKGGRYVEALAAVNVVALDKTGTLTSGELTVLDAIWQPSAEQPHGKGLLYAVEALSAHPAAAALRAYVNGTTPEVVESIEELSGLGVRAVWHGKIVLCGNRRLLDAMGVTPYTPQASVWLTVDGEEFAAFTLGSVLRPEAGEALAALRALGVARLDMVTGDSEAAAQTVAAQLPLDRVYAAQMPEDKQRVVEALKATVGVTAFVGDGINDAPVLALSDVGVAMGLGSTAALEAGDVVLMGDRLTQLPEAICLSRRILRTVQVNVAFALAVKFAVLVFAALGIASMWLAVFADVGVSLLCIFNAMRLLWSRQNG